MQLSYQVLELLVLLKNRLIEGKRVDCEPHGGVELSGRPTAGRSCWAGRPQRIGCSCIASVNLTPQPQRDIG